MPVTPSVAPAVEATVKGTIMPLESVSDEQLNKMNLSRAHFVAYNEAAFQPEQVPEVAPPVEVA